MKPERAVILDRTVGQLVYRFHHWIYRVTNGRIGAKSSVGPILILTTTGRKTGRPRAHPLLYMPDGDAFLVVGSNAGRAAAPAWSLNLAAHPQATVQVGRRLLQAHAKRLEGAERDAVWPRLIAFYPGWAHSASMTTRTLPVVRLEPR